MITIRHRSASGRLDMLWEFDPARRVIDAVLRMEGGPELAFAIRVCAPDKPIPFAHPILRLDSESWHILPAVFVPEDEPSRSTAIDAPHSVRALELRPRDCLARPEHRSLSGHDIPCALHRAIGGGTHLVLTNAPEAQDRELMELAL